MEQRRELEASRENEDWKRLRRGWCWGAKGFREKLLEIVGERKGQQHYGEEVRESDQQKAERLVVEMMRRLGWTKKELKRLAKGDAHKAEMAARLRAETTVTWSWIAKRLEMGHWRTAVNATKGQRAGGGPATRQ
jgi:hypothetical protein